MYIEWAVLQLPRQHEVSGDVQAGVRLQEDEVQLRCTNVDLPNRDGNGNKCKWGDSLAIGKKM